MSVSVSIMQPFDSRLLLPMSSFRLEPIVKASLGRIEIH